MSEFDEQQERTRAAREALIGKSIAERYVLRSLVGHGGMGAVYEAEHLGLGKRVAIKFIDPEFATDERVVARFAREARAMSAVESGHIVTVFDAGTDEGRPYLVMELLRGEDLGQRLRRTHRVPVPQALHVVAQVLKGLAKAHRAGIIHRDLKPDNVFILKTDADPLFVKIVDFGVSKIERPRDKTSPLALTGRGTVLGTPFYMSPEQAQAMSDLDARADLYSVGAILFECLTGRPPHTGETYEQIILSICMRDAPDVRSIDPTVSPEVAAFVARALARDRHERFASSERMLAALHEIAPEEKGRVPLEVGASETLMSPGVLFPAPRKADVPSSPVVIAAATRIAGSATGRSLAEGSASAEPSSGPRPAAAIASAAAKGSREPSADVPVSSRKAARKGSLTAIVVTASLATLLGVAVMLAIILAVSSKPNPSTNARPAPTPDPPTTITSGVAPSNPPAPLPLPSPAEPSSSASAAPPATTVKGRPSKPRSSSGAGAGSAPAKPLDISRDLP